jgi:hypothetical protein
VLPMPMEVFLPLLLVAASRLDITLHVSFTRLGKVLKFTGIGNDDRSRYGKIWSPSAIVSKTSKDN